jgi:hypothetical protein
VISWGAAGEFMVYGEKSASPSCVAPATTTTRTGPVSSPPTHVAHDSSAPATNIANPDHTPTTCPASVATTNPTTATATATDNATATAVPVCTTNATTTTATATAIKSTDTLVDRETQYTVVYWRLRLWLSPPVLICNKTNGCGRGLGRSVDHGGDSRKTVASYDHGTPTVILTVAATATATATAAATTAAAAPTQTYSATEVPPRGSATQRYPHSKTNLQAQAQAQRFRGGGYYQTTEAAGWWCRRDNWSMHVLKQRQDVHGWWTEDECWRRGGCQAADHRFEDQTSP